MFLSSKSESREPVKRGLEEKALRTIYRWSTILPLRKEAPQEIHYISRSGI